MSARRFALRTAAAAALLASTALAPVARAGDASLDRDNVPGSYTAYLKMKPMSVMHMMDMDKKGFVTKDDFMKFHEIMFQKMDKNADGKLDRAEWAGGGR